MNRSKLWTLIKYFISIDFFAILSIKENIKTKGKRSAAFQGIIAVIVYLGMFLWLAPVIGKFLSKSIISQTGGMFVTAVIIGLSICLLFFSLATAFVFIEKNNESEMLLSLPISGSDIICARMYSLAFTFFTSFVLTIMIAFFMVGYYLQNSILYYIVTFLTFILLDLEVIFISGILILLFGRLIRRSKFFNRFAKVIYSVFLLGLFALYMVFSQTFSNPDITNNLVYVVSQTESLVSKIFFIFTWAKNILLFNSLSTVLINLLIGVLFTGILWAIFKKLSQKNYLEILRLSNVISKESEAVINKRKKIGLKGKRNYKLVALMKKELSDLFSTPTYLLQLVVVDFMFLVLAIIIVFFASKDASKANVDISFVLSTISTFDLIAYSIAVGGALGLLFGLSSLTISSVSREGKAFWVMATAPIGVNTQILSRIFACQITHLLGILLIVFSTMIIYIFNPVVYLFVIIGAALTLFASGTINMILGLIKPHFEWKTPKEALNGGSGSLTAFLSVLINYGIYAVMIFLTMFLLKREISLPITILANGSVILIATVIAYFIDYKLYKKILKNL